VPESEPRAILATGSYIGEGFADARLDTLFIRYRDWYTVEEEAPPASSSATAATF
jgi:hypothetical protein